MLDQADSFVADSFLGAGEDGSGEDEQSTHFDVEDDSEGSSGEVHVEFDAVDGGTASTTKGRSRKTRRRLEVDDSSAPKTPKPASPVRGATEAEELDSLRQEDNSSTDH